MRAMCAVLFVSVASLAVFLASSGPANTGVAVFKGIVPHQPAYLASEFDASVRAVGIVALEDDYGVVAAVEFGPLTAGPWNVQFLTTKLPSPSSRRALVSLTKWQSDIITEDHGPWPSMNALSSDGP